MALQKQVVPIEIATGIDTKTDPKKVTGRLLSVVNAVLTQSKSLLKRFGYAGKPQTILGGSSIASGVTISPYQNELVVLDGKSLYSFSDQQSSWANKGPLPTCSLSVSSVVKNSRGQSLQDQAQHVSGFQVFAWEDTAGGSYYSVIDSGTGQTVVNSKQLSVTGYMPKPMAIGNYIVIFYYEQSIPALVYKAINMSTPTAIGSAVTVETSLNTLFLPINSICYDVALVGTSLAIVVAGSSNIGGRTLSSALALSSRTGFGTVSQNTQNLAVFGDASGNIWVAWFITVGNVNLEIFSSGFASVVLAQTGLDSFGAAPDFYSVRNLTGVVIGTTGYIFYESDQLSRFINGATIAFYGDYIRSIACTIAGSVGTPYNVIRGIGIASKPFVYNGTIYMLGVYDARRPSSTVGQLYDLSNESTYFVVDSAGNILAKLAQGNGGGVLPKYIAPEALTISSGVFQLGYLFKDLLVSQESNVFTQAGVQKAAVSFNGIYPSKLQIGQTLLLGGGSVYQYDGASPTELNFHLYPELMTSWTGLTGGALSIGSYEYQSVYEWTDNQGQLNRSGVSDALVVKTALPQVVVTTNSTTTLVVNFDSNGSYSYNTFNNLAIGFLISGAGIPAGTTITGFNQTGTIPSRQQIYISAAAAASSGEVTITTTPQFGITATSNDLQTSLVVDPILYFLDSFYTTVSGMYAADLSFLAVGMTLYQPINNGGTTSGYITAIDPVSRKVVCSYSGAGSGNVMQVLKQFTGTFTNGSNTITAVSPQIFPLLLVGDTGLTANGQSFTITSFNAGTLTINTSTIWVLSTVTQTANVYFPAGAFLKPGQTITGSYLPANTFIKTVANSGNSSTTITVSAPATSTQTSAAYTITNLFSNVLSVPSIRETSKSSVSLVLYRTQNNQTLLYRSTPVTSPVINNPALDFAYLFDSIADTVITGNEQIYTTGGEVENTAPPATNAIVTYKNRAVLVPYENPLTYWYSKQVVPGSPVEFSPYFIENVDSLGGNIIAPAVMDDKLILFKEYNIFYVVGSGPTPAGTQNDFTDAQLISADTGCNNPASIVLTPDGLMFQSPKGIYLLSRSLAVEYIGAGVEAFNSMTVTSATLLESVNQARFTLSSGAVLVYDYYEKQWYEHLNIAAVDACMYQGIYNYLTAAGLVNAETPGSFTDNGAFIRWALRQAG